MNVENIRSKLRTIANPEVAKTSQWFFKTGPGQYGEGDIFLGIKLPLLLQLVKEFKDISVTEAENLLHSEFH